MFSLEIYLEHGVTNIHIFEVFMAGVFAYSYATFPACFYVPSVAAESVW